MQDLKEKTIRGGYARICSQAASFLLRLGSLMVLARLLNPNDFGLVGMVTAFTGVLNLFRDFGLSAATVQCPTVSEEQKSTLFWINILCGAILTVVTLILAPVVGTFYHEPRLVRVTALIASGFLFNAFGIQHSALLQRQMRFTALALIETASLIVSASIAIAGAKAGYGYWALVAMTITLPLTSSIGFWIVADWVPGRLRRGVGIRSMMQFGGAMTLNGLVVYAASNVEKVLLGRFWGADAIGIYGRAYQLIRIPTDSLNGAVGEVAFSALSRIQHEPGRLRSYFLKGYSLVLAVTVPATIACALFADDLVAVFLGEKWKGVSAIFRLLSPTILVFAVANPLSWLLTAIGLVGRTLKMALLIAPTMICGYLVGLPFGPRGVAVAYSVVMALWIVPLIVWLLRGTGISPGDIFNVAIRPLGASLFAAGVAAGSAVLLHRLMPLTRVIVENFILFAVYVIALLAVAGRQSVYWTVLLGWRGSPTVVEKSLAAI